MHISNVLLDKFGTAFEIHHRLKTQPEIKNSDFLAKNLLKKKENFLLGYQLALQTIIMHLFIVVTMQ